MRAFLSHSSKDKAFVSSVANQLGRQFCIFDQYEFESGEDFRSSIRNGIDKSTIFVLFASINSTPSTWVKFEEDEAELRAIKALIYRPLVFLLDEKTTLSDLPEWLAKGRVVNASSPKAVAREVQHYLQDSIRVQQQPVFVGRRNEQTIAEDVLLDYSDENPTRVFAFHGLSGIGRRTLAKRVARDLLSLSRVVVIGIQEGDSMLEIAAKLAEHVEVYSTMAELKALITKFKNYDERELADLITLDLQHLIQRQELPVFFDVGGLLDNDGFLTTDIVRILEILPAYENTYLCLVTARKLYTDRDRTTIKVPTIRVQPLQKSEVEKLIGTLAQRMSLSVKKDQVAELAEYVRGYPPAAHYAMEMAREYGVDAIIADKYPLVEFRTSHFLAYISREEILREEQRRILAILATYSPLPLPVLGKIVDLDARTLSEVLSFLIDTCLVIPCENGMYEVADPVVEAAQRMIHRSEIPHQRIAITIDKYLKLDVEPDYLLSMGRHLFKANRLSGHKAETVNEIDLISDLISLETECYHSRDYERAIEYGLASLEARPNSTEARTYVIRSLAQMERYDEAEKHLEYLLSSGSLRDYYYLRGFVARLDGKIDKAIEYYKQSIERGRRGLSVQRELAYCYFLIGDLSNAHNHIEKAQSISPDNRYVVDLKIIIAIHQKNEESARKGLALLGVIDKKEFYSHRQSTVELAFGHPVEALDAAKYALTFTERPTFAMLTQAAKAAIACRQLPLATSFINELENRFRSLKRDIKTGLRCRWEIASGNFKNALSYYDTLTDKSNKIHKALRRDILSGFLSTPGELTPSIALEYRKEVAELETELLDIDFLDAIENLE